MPLKIILWLQYFFDIFQEPSTLVYFQVTRRTPVNSRPVMSTQSVRSTNGRGRRSASAMQATSAWTVCPARASASCGLTSVLMMASVTSSPAKEPSAGGCRLRIVICLHASVWQVIWARTSLKQGQRIKTSWIFWILQSKLLEKRFWGSFKTHLVTSNVSPKTCEGD